MPWVVFQKDFTFRLTRHCMRAYRSGQTALVMQRCAEKAIAAEKARLATEAEADGARRRTQMADRVLRSRR